MKLKLLLLIATLSFNNLFACKCLEIDTETRVKQTDNIFIAKLMKAKLKKDSQGFPIIEANFQLKKKYKGEASKNLSFTTGIGQGDCGVKMTIGRNYLIFNTKNDSSIDICSGTRLVTYKDETLLKNIENIINK